MNIKRVLLSLSFFSILTACASAQKSEPTQAPAEKIQVENLGGETIKVDLDGLKRSLGLDRSRGDLGYEEKRFNTCSAGFGYPRTNCKDQTYVSIHFRLQCRDSMGTTSEVVTGAQMDPIASKQVRWQMGKNQSVTQTDHEGYGQINAVVSHTPPPKGQRLRLAVGGQFVYMRAGEITRIVTPSNWCGSN